MSGVWLDVGFESLRGGKSAGDATRDRSRRWQAVAAAEDEVLICVCAKLVDGRIPPPPEWGETHRRRGPGRGL